MSSVRAAEAALMRARRDAAAAEKAVAAAEQHASQAQAALTAARERAQAARWTALRAEHDLDAARRAPPRSRATPQPPRTRPRPAAKPARTIPFPRPLRAPPAGAAAHAAPTHDDAPPSSARARGARSAPPTARERQAHAAPTGRDRRDHAAPASTVREPPAPRAPAPRAPSPRARAAALAALQDLLPDRITARFGKASRELRLEAGATYRVEPLNAAKKRDRGRVGTLLTWDVSGTSGVLAWSDGGGRGNVALADLVRA